MIQLLLAIIYLAFISLGLPDSLLGSAWPSMYREFSVPISYMGGISMIIAAGTIYSSLQCDRLTQKLGTGKVTAFSVLTTAVALFGFSISHSYAALCLWAIPYGLGAGCVDASLNNYVALHYASRNMGYRYISILQIVLTAILLFSLPLWTRKTDAPDSDDSSSASGKKPLSLAQIVRIPGAKEVMTAFFCYCALEQTTGLWASSYLVLHWGVSAETAASFASLFYIGITVGRALGGFLTLKLDDTQMIRLGQGIVLFGIVLMLLPFTKRIAMLGLILVGLGCAPIYPSIIHSTPKHFGADKSQAMIGVQMASAYVGTCLMPPVFGFLANHMGVVLLPFFLLLILAAMFFMHERLLKKAK